jgi:hypothetical protein
MPVGPAAVPVALAGVAAGLVNALAGGGSLISFPALLATGLPAVIANLSNTVALLPGYFGATLAQRRDLAGQGPRLLVLLPLAAAGGLVGALLLLHTDPRLFTALVPFLVLAASALLAQQEPLRRRLQQRRSQPERLRSGWLPGVAVGLASIYGGYFGAGLGVIVLAVLALTLEDDLRRLNGLKQPIALSANISAALVFLGSGRVAWPEAIGLGLGALIGGALGGRIVGWIPPQLLRNLVVILGVGVAVHAWWR